MSNPSYLDVFRTSVRFDLGPFHSTETGPTYATKLPAGLTYYCFTEKLENLGRIIAEKASERNERVIPRNLTKAEYLPINSVNGLILPKDGGITVHHQPLEELQ